MKQIPYKTSTGLLIGSRYKESPDPIPLDDPDMLHIQSVLICKPKWHRQRNIERKVIFGSFVALFLLCIVYTMGAK